MEKNKVNNYKSTYGLLRIIACVSVIYHHFMPSIYNDLHYQAERNVFMLVDNILMCCNGLFFMLSGKFALENYRGNIVVYYKDKLLKIVLPMVMISFFSFSIVYSGNDIRDFWVRFVTMLLGNQIIDYLWFVYALIGFYLVVPFLAPMVKNMTEMDKIFFSVVMVFCMILSNLCNILHLPYVLNIYPFVGNLMYCMWGYLVDNTLMFCKWKKKLYVATIIACIISSVEILVFPGINPEIYGNCLSRLLMCTGVYCWITRCKWEFCVHKYSYVIAYFAKHTYYIYLFHGTAQAIVVSWLLKVIGDKTNLFINIIIGGSAIWCIALLMSITYKVLEEKILCGLRKILCGLRKTLAK